MGARRLGKDSEEEGTEARTTKYTIIIWACILISSEASLLLTFGILQVYKVIKMETQDPGSLVQKIPMVSGRAFSRAIL